MKLKDVNVGSALMFGAGVVALVYGTHKAKQAKKAAKILDETVDRLSEMTVVEVQDAVIQAAADKAAEKAAKEAVETVRKDIDARVRATVTAAHEDVETETRNRLAKELERDFDMEKLALKVEKRATAAVVDKFMSSLDDYVEPITEHILTAVRKKR